MIKPKDTYESKLCIFFIFELFFFNFELFVKCHLSIWSHHALGRVECDESYCNKGETIFGRLGAGNSFTMSHTRASS
jgi:hypothetical protein